MSIAAVESHYGVYMNWWFVLSRKMKGSRKASAPPCTKVLVYVIMALFSKRRKWLSAHGWKIVMVALMAPYQEVYKDMQKKVQQSNITTFFTKVFCLCLFPALCVITASWPFSPRKANIVPITMNTIFSCLWTINLHFIMLCMPWFPYTHFFHKVLVSCIAFPLFCCMKLVSE